jgi:hypothetical protein
MAGIQFVKSRFDRFENRTDRKTRAFVENVARRIVERGGPKPDRIFAVFRFKGGKNVKFFVDEIEIVERFLNAFERSISPWRSLAVVYLEIDNQWIVFDAIRPVTQSSIRTVIGETEEYLTNALQKTLLKTEIWYDGDREIERAWEQERERTKRRKR